MGREDHLGLGDPDKLGERGIDAYVNALRKELETVSGEETDLIRQEREAARKEVARRSLKKDVVGEITRRVGRGLMPQYGDDNKVEYLADFVLGTMKASTRDEAHDQVRNIFRKASTVPGRKALLDKVLSLALTEESKRGNP